ncbi:MAG: VWA domain-containing protein [Proteobacteria bacterium]|nr:VWA domain-containing protein [Pseudomonadota bacterium]
MNTALQDDGRLVQNIIYFCRALRRAGVPVGTAQVKETIRAVQAVGFTKRADFFVTLRACLITRVEHMQVFLQVFNMFWRDPEFLEHMMQLMLPMLQDATAIPKKPKDAQTRAAEAMAEGLGGNVPQAEQEELVLDARSSTSQAERLGAMDFEQMNTAEMRDAEKAIANMRLDIRKRASRRTRPAAWGRKPDVRAAFRAARKTGGEVLHLPKIAPRKKIPNLVVLTDISGSMSTYSRMMLHFIHAMTRTKDAHWAEVHAFTFGTRLSNISRHIMQKDPDAALQAIGQQVQDWDGGTQIGESLKAFNYTWSRRVLNTDAVVLLITDGLECQDTDLLQAEMRRLRLSCNHLIWLNPLLRFDGFAPLAAGIRVMLPYVDSFAACHNLASLHELTEALNGAKNMDVKQQMMAAI